MSEFKSGDKVRHRIFGPGVVAAVAGSGAGARITVDFSTSVGRKTLLAEVAKLEPISAEVSQAASASGGAWFEVLDATAKPRPGRRVNLDTLRAEVSSEVIKPEFWIAVRERLRARGRMPKVIDALNGRMSVSVKGTLHLRILVQHDSMNDARDPVLSTAISDELAVRVLRDFERISIRHDAGVDFSLDENDLTFIQDAELGELPARDMRQRPKRVQPKGVIRSMPKRRDDY